MSLLEGMLLGVMLIRQALDTISLPSHLTPDLLLCFWHGGYCSYSNDWFNTINASWSLSSMRTIYTADPATLRRFDRFCLQLSHYLVVQEQRKKTLPKQIKDHNPTWHGNPHDMLWWGAACRSIFHCQISLIKQISQSGRHGCVHDSWELLTYALHGASLLH